MESGEANGLRPIQKLKAVKRGRKISTATTTLILSFVVTAAAQSERIADQVRERNETATMSLSSGSGYKIPKRGAKAMLTVLNAP